MKVLHTIAGVQVDHGGTSRSVPATINALADQGCDVHLLTAIPADPSCTSSFPRDRERLTTISESAWTGRCFVGRQFELQLAKLVQAPGLTILHDHGLWLPSNRAVGRYANRLHIARIVSPRGMLGDWSVRHHAWRKWLAWKLFQRRALATADAFHATSQQEAEEIRRCGFTQPIVVVPNGIDVPAQLPARRTSEAPRQALFLSRLHPKKGLLSLVQAWKEAASASPAASWRLVIAGPDEGGHRAEVGQEIERLGLGNQIELLGPLSDSDKWQWYVDSDLFILPSFNENFGIVIAEALAAGLPVLTTTGTPWAVLSQQEYGWWVEPSLPALSQALRQAFSLPAEQLQAMGKRGQAYAMQNFSWVRAAEQLLGFYKQVLIRKHAAPLRPESPLN